MMKTTITAPRRSILAQQVQAVILGAAIGLASASVQANTSEVTWDDILNDQTTPEDVLGYGIGPKAQRYSPLTKRQH